MVGLLLIALAIGLWGLPAPVYAQTEGGTGGAESAADPRRPVAVLGFRAGASELPDIDRRLADILAETTSLDVVGIRDARRRYGDRLDGDVVSCGGDLACIATIGRELGVADIVLVGVSRFGDVIITLQRIDVAAESVRARIAEAMAPDHEPDRDALLEYLRRVMPENDFRRYGVIRIEANIAGAAVHIGGAKRGQTPLAPIRVTAPNNYDIRVAKDGFVPFLAETAVPPNGEVLVRATLTPRTPAWYRRWWVWTLIGTTAAAGAGVGYLLLRDEPQQRVPIRIEFP